MSSEELTERLLDFAARIGKVVDALPATKFADHIAEQLARAATSALARYERAAETNGGRSLVICMRRLRECRLLIRLIVKQGFFPADRLQPLLDECCQLADALAERIDEPVPGTPQDPSIDEPAETHPPNA